jgi:hypothetical protein
MFKILKLVAKIVIEVVKNALPYIITETIKRYQDKK